MSEAAATALIEMRQHRTSEHAGATTPFADADFKASIEIGKSGKQADSKMDSFAAQAASNPA